MGRVIQELKVKVRWVVIELRVKEVQVEWW